MAPCNLPALGHGAEPHEHRQAVYKRGKGTTTIYRWLNAVPLRDGGCLPGQSVLHRDP
jgi:hypothetical protein